MKTSLHYNTVSALTRRGSRACRYAIGTAMIIALAGCTTPPTPPTKHIAVFTPPPSPDSVLTQTAFHEDQKGQSGFLLMDRGWSSLACRCALADQARQSLNVQYFAWYADAPGLLLADHLLAAAERGVYVRLLLDDLSLKVGTRLLARLDAHTNIEVRTYNPVRGDYEKVIQRNLQVAKDFTHMQRRMHNKLFLADASMGLVGGRNIGDKYFDLSSDHNYRDRDVLAIGPVATNLAATFDVYWNSAWVLDLEDTISYRPDAREMAETIAALPGRMAEATRKLRLGDDLAAMVSLLTNAWTDAHRGTAEIIVDEPGKNEDAQSMTAFGTTSQRLTELALSTKKELIIQTPYAVLMPGTFDLLNALQQKGVKVRILTNSKLSSLNPFAVTAYARQRPDMLKAQVELFELRPDGQVFKSTVSSRAEDAPEVPASLHAKGGIFDDEHVYIGSFNLDPRSTHLNTELGLYIHSPTLNRELRRIMEEECLPQNSWQVVMGDHGQLQWISWEDGKVVRLDEEPGVGVMKSTMLFLLSLLPLDPLL